MSPSQPGLPRLYLPLPVLISPDLVQGLVPRAPHPQAWSGRERARARQGGRAEAAIPGWEGSSRPSVGPRVSVTKWRSQVLRLRQATHHSSRSDFSEASPILLQAIIVPSSGGLPVSVRLGKSVPRHPRRLLRLSHYHGHSRGDTKACWPCCPLSTGKVTSQVSAHPGPVLLGSSSVSLGFLLSLFSLGLFVSVFLPPRSLLSASPLAISASHFLSAVCSHVCPCLCPFSLPSPAARMWPRGGHGRKRRPEPQHTDSTCWPHSAPEPSPPRPQAPGMPRSGRRGQKAKGGVALGEVYVF